MDKLAIFEQKETRHADNESEMYFPLVDKIGQLLAKGRRVRIRKCR